MASKKNVSVNLSDYEERNNITPQSNAAMQSNSTTRDNASTQDNAQVANTAATKTRKATQKRTTTQLPVRRQIPRSNGCTYYLEDAHIAYLDQIKCYNHLDKQDIVRTALDIFLHKYINAEGNRLTEEGIKEVENYMYDTTQQ